MKVESNVKIKADKLVHCPWNPRGEITAESVADLAASIREKGLLQDIGVMCIPGSDGYWVIYGNRRFVAAVTSGMGEIPCKVYSELSETDAREITRIENEVRLGIDPLKDAELLHSFVQAGRSYEDVGLMFGVSAATVCRREKLIDLDESIRKMMADGAVTIATNALEHIASYPADIQKKASSAIKNRGCYSEIRWNDIRHTFDSITNDLDEAQFIKAGYSVKCTACMNRTGCQTDLFGALTGDGKLGRCLDGRCFGSTKKEWIADELNRKIPAECTERVEMRYSWQMEGSAYGPKMTKSKPCAYYCVCWDGTVEVKFGPSKSALEAEEAERKRIEEDRRQQEDVRNKQRRLVHSKLDSLLSDESEDGHAASGSVGLRDVLEDYFSKAKTDFDRLGMFVHAAFKLGLSCSYSDYTAYSDIASDPVGEFVKMFGEGLHYEAVEVWNWYDRAGDVIKVLGLKSRFTKEEIALLD